MGINRTDHIMVKVTRFRVRNFWIETSCKLTLHVMASTALLALNGETISASEIVDLRCLIVVDELLHEPEIALQTLYASFLKL